MRGQVFAVLTALTLLALSPFAVEWAAGHFVIVLGVVFFLTVVFLAVAGQAHEAWTSRSRAVSPPLPARSGSRPRSGRPAHVSRRRLGGRGARYSSSRSPRPDVPSSQGLGGLYK